jgi:threonine dehydrogenase-like Zn-dependent dehydrogenase
MIEPLAVALHGCRRAGVSAGSNVLITGAGTALCHIKTYNNRSNCLRS